MTPTARIVLKLGGELLAEPAQRRDVAAAVGRLADVAALVVVHGGGREVDAELAGRGIAKRAVDGLRVTDAATLGVVVGMLAGRVNTALVAAARAAGVRAVGLTAADAGVAAVERAAPYAAADGSVVDLGFVGQPSGDAPPALLETLCAAGFVPVVASIGAAADGQLLNVNADTLAGDLAVRFRAGRLLVAGGTAGVLDPRGDTLPSIDDATLEELIADGRASAGMVAKLNACRHARRHGVERVEIVDGRGPGDLDGRPGSRIA